MSNIVMAYKATFATGAIAFAVAAFSTHPYFGDGNEEFYETSIMVSAVSMIIMEILELGAAPIPFWRTPICTLGVLGQLFLIHSANIYQYFNKGALYLVALFCISLAAELKMLSLILQNRTYEAIMKKQLKRFTQLALQIVGSIFFLVGSLFSELIPDSVNLVGTLNSLGGICYIAAFLTIFFKFKSSKPGYRKFASHMQIPRIATESLQI